jgi:hypothetical protein
LGYPKATAGVTLMKKSQWWRLDLNSALALFLAGLLIPSAALQAQDAPQPSSEDEILVTGVRDRLETIDRYVKGLTIVRSGDPLSRYEPGTFCPAVIGLTERLNSEVTARMRTVAAAAGVSPAKPQCAPNALVMFAANKASFMRAFRKQHPVYFSDLQTKDELPPPESGPAIAWHLVQLLDPQGNPVRRTPSGIGMVESPAGGSRIRAMVQPVVIMSVVVVERKALLGLTPTQIADYAIMRTLTDRAPDLSRVPNEVTILRALTAPMGSAVPASLTDWDFAYLKGRYSGDPRFFGPSQSAAIRNSVRQAVEKKRN